VTTKLWLQDTRERATANGFDTSLRKTMRRSG
jgi:hypothetical protein